MLTLDSVAVADTFPEPGKGGALLLEEGGSNGGYFAVTGNDVYVELAYGRQGAIFWTEPVHVSPGNGILQPGTAGVRFRNYTPGQVATVSAGLSSRSEPSLQLTAAGVSSSGVQLPKVLASNGTLVDVVNNAGETDLWAQTIAAGSLGVNDGVLLRLFGDLKNASGVGRNFSFRILLGGNTLWRSPTAGNGFLASAAGRRPFALELLLGNRNASNSQVAAGTISIGSDVAALVGEGAPPVTFGYTGGTLPAQGAAVIPFLGTGTVDMTAAQTLEVTILHDVADPNVETRMFYGYSMQV